MPMMRIADLVELASPRSPSPRSPGGGSPGGVKAKKSKKPGGGASSPAATKASANFLKALAENPVEKFTRHLKAIGPACIYQVCLDVWLTLERHGEAATRLACEMMCDYNARNFVLDDANHVLGEPWREVLEGKKEAVLGLFKAAKGWGGEARSGGGTTAVQNVVRRFCSW